MRRVVVTGMGLVTPLGVGLERNWSSLVEGVSGVRTIQSFDVSDLPVKIAGQVPRGETAAGLFNSDDWVPPKDQRKMDGFIVFALAAAAQAVLVSGDRHLLTLADAIPVYSPAQFLALLDNVR